MFGNYRKIEKRILSVILVMAMTVSLLSGCGQKKETVENKDTTVWETARDKAGSFKQELVMASGETENILNQLETSLDKGDSRNATSLSEALSKQLEETKEQTEEWLSSQKVLNTVLDEKERKLLKEREEVFSKELEKAQKNVSELLSDLQSALNENKTDEAAKKVEELRSLLVEEETPQTYGTSLPSEVEIPESAEEVYREESNTSSDGQTAEPGSSPQTEESAQAVSEAVTNELLATEGDTGLSDAIKEKAEELETPLAIYNYVKNNIGYEYYYGSRKGASGTLDSLGGNDLDQASLLIAMLRHQGYQAEYVKGNILLTEEQALSLTGAATFRQAADVLASAGIPVTRLMRGEEIVYIRMEHVWVRAYIPYTDYRGAGNASGDKVWLDLDTGIKDYEAVTNIYDTLDEDGFSEQIQSITETGDTAQLETLLSQWEEQLESKDLSETYA
ncbi:MAG: transglutaminase domain-containing protein, partial [Lachnospiraceae bacterium]